MNKYLFLLIPLILAGCTDNNLNNLSGHEYNNQFNINESRVFNSLSDFPFLESANPLPGSAGFATNDFIVLRFKNWGGYSGFSFALYEKSSMNSVSIDTTTFDSFDGNDLGLIPSDDYGIAALKANTTYILSMTNMTDYSEYYYEFTTGEEDNVKPTVKSARFENNQLAILFSETVKSWTFKEGNNFVLTKDGITVPQDFENIWTSAGYGWENVNYYIDYTNLTSGSYALTLRNIQDASGNMIEDYSTTIIKE